MTEHSARHATFTIVRRLKHPVARVYTAYADPAQKRRWFAGRGAEELERQFDFRIGGEERLVGRWHDGPAHEMSGVYFDIVENARIVMAYRMALEGKPISVSLGTTEFKAEGDATVLTYTEQSAFLDGFDDAGGRERGTNGLFDQLERMLDAV